MNKKIISIILSLIIVFGAVMIISGCNKDDENKPIINESTHTVVGTEQSTEEAPSNETESNSGEQETENQPEKESETKETESSQTEKPTDSDESVTCKTCGNIVLPDSYSGELKVGNYCDGKCDEWLGEIKLEN